MRAAAVLRRFVPAKGLVDLVSLFRGGDRQWVLLGAHWVPCWDCCEEHGMRRVGRPWALDGYHLWRVDSDRGSLDPNKMGLWRGRFLGIGDGKSQRGPIPLKRVTSQVHRRQLGECARAVGTCAST